MHIYMNLIRMNNKKGDCFQNSLQLVSLTNGQLYTDSLDSDGQQCKTTRLHDHKCPDLNITLFRYLSCVVSYIATETYQKYSVTVIFYYIFHVKPLYCIFDVQNLVLCLNRELVKIIDYKFMLKLQCKTTFNSVFVGKKNHQNRRKFVGTKIPPPNINAQKKVLVHSLNPVQRF
jgi:hypothetical protein